MKNTLIFLNKHIFIFWDAQNPEKKNRVDTVEKWLGPRPLGPIGLLHVQNPNMSFGNLQTQTKRFLHVQNPKMSFGNLQTQTKRFVKTTLFYGPKAPGAHRAHILLLNIFIYLF